MSAAARLWFESSYDPDEDPAVLRERDLIDALREHTEALRFSADRGGSHDREDRSGVRPLASDAGGSRAEFVSQRTAQAILGLSRRQFLDLLRRDDAPPVSAIGKLRMVRRDAMLAFVERLGTKLREREVEDHDVDGADTVLREIGCAPVRGRR